MTITNEVLLYQPETSTLTLAKAHAQHLDSPGAFCGDLDRDRRARLFRLARGYPDNIPRRRRVLRVSRVR